MEHSYHRQPQGREEPSSSNCISTEPAPATGTSNVGRAPTYDDGDVIELPSSTSNFDPYSKIDFADLSFEELVKYFGDPMADPNIRYEWGPNQSYFYNKNEPNVVPMYAHGDNELLSREAEAAPPRTSMKKIPTEIGESSAGPSTGGHYDFCYDAVNNNNEEGEYNMETELPSSSMSTQPDLVPAWHNASYESSDLNTPSSSSSSKSTPMPKEATSMKRTARDLDDEEEDTDEQYDSENSSEDEDNFRKDNFILPKRCKKNMRRHRSREARMWERIAVYEFNQKLY